jgi:type 1 glutamine amidotransferase
MKQRWCVSMLCAVAVCAALVSPGRGQEAKPVRVLFVLGSAAVHDIRNLPPILEKVLGDVGGFQVTRLEPPKDKPPQDGAHLARLADIKGADYDVLVFYTMGYGLNDAQERALQKFVEDGGGIVALHSASLTFNNSRVWGEFLGARFAGHIPGLHKLNVVIADPQHPVTAGVEPFTVVDEEYRHKFAEVKRQVLARFKERPEKSDQKLNMDIVWTREIGKGRVLYSALGHGREAWENPAWQKLIVQGILWSAGQPRVVTLPKATN